MIRRRMYRLMLSLVLTITLIRSSFNAIKLLRATSAVSLDATAALFRSLWPLPETRNLTNKVQSTTIDDDVASYSFAGHRIWRFTDTALDQEGENTSHHQEEWPISRIHCLSENFSPNGTMTADYRFRSCRIENLCYSLADNKFVVFPSQNHWKLLSKVHSNIFLSTELKPFMTTTNHKRPQPWLPQRMNHSREASYYMLDDNLIWIPIHAWESGNFHALWNTWLPIYSLLEIFDLATQDKSKRYKLWITVIGQDNQSINSTIQALLEYSEFMRVSSPDILSIHELPSLVSPSLASTLAPIYICAKIGVNGLGPHSHLEVPRRMPRDPREQLGVPPRNVRRARNIAGFRRYMLQNLQFRDNVTVSELPKPSIVTFCTHSAATTALMKQLAEHVEREIPGTLVQRLTCNEKTFREQIEIVSQTTILVTISQNDNSVALFLPVGAVMVILGDAGDDWDLWSNNALLHMHLIQADNQTELVLELVLRDELERIDSSKSDKANDAKANDIFPFIEGRHVSLIRQRPPTTRVHCIGEKILPNNRGADRFRSCYFDNLCFDLEKKDFVMFPSKYSRRLQDLATDRSYFSSLPYPVITYGQPSNLGSAQPLTFQPIDPFNISSHYYLNGVWLAMRTFNTCNHGHIAWDTHLPLFSILELFSLTKEELLVTRYPFKPDCVATTTPMEAALGFRNRTKFHADVQVSNTEAKYICVSHAASGYGALSDHVSKGHGWLSSDLESQVNIRRGPELQRFRSFLLRNMGLAPRRKLETPYRVTFSILSSRDTSRRLDFRHEISALKNHIPNVQVEGVHMFGLSLDEQVDIATRSAIFVSAVGGGTFPAFFLPTGSTLILYGDKNMYLDYDLFVNYGHIRVHWLSLSSRQSDLGLLLDLVWDEIDYISSQNRNLQI